MKRFLHALAAIICLIGSPYVAMADDARIEAIRTRYAEVDAGLSKCKRIKRELAGYSAEGGDLTAWLLGGSLRKMTALHLGETGKASEDYYFWDNQLFFVLRVESRYTAPLSGKVKSTAEDRFYFDDGKLIRWIDSSKKQNDPGSTNAQKRGSEILEQAKDFATFAKGGK